MSGLTEGPKETNVAPVDRVSRLWTGLTERKLAQWTVGYIALAYGIQHGIILTAESFEWPNAVARISMLLLVLGLPLVVTLAWYHGERASRHFSHAELTIVSLLLVGIALLFYVFVKPAEEAAAPPASRQAGVTAARTAAADPSGTISLAVLPFVNLSSDKEQEFFSDGMTEEITAALAQVPGLRVIGRTSAFEFKDQNKDLRAIGQALGATHLIEGSVRKAGNRVRITAQLIRAGDDSHLWAQNYDRELTDVFEIQENIAQAIASALQVPLGLQQGGLLVRDRTKDLASYDQYLRARSLVRGRGTDIAQAVTVLEPVVARDPDFAPAWAMLALAYELTPIYTPSSYEAAMRSGNAAAVREAIRGLYDKAEKAAREAVRLDPRFPVSYEVLGRIEFERGKWTAAEDLFKQALTLDPNDPEVLQGYGLHLALAGRLKDSLSIRGRLLTLEPFVPTFNLQTALIMHVAGQSGPAAAILEKSRAEERAGILAWVQAAAGRYGEAADTLLGFRAANVERREVVEEAARLLRTAPAKASGPLPDLGIMNFVYPYVGAPERVLDYPERVRNLGLPFDVTMINSLWSAASAPVRKTARFKSFVRDNGMVDYWKARGWPDLCHPVGADDFACD